jgi:hypothetical protein
MEAGKDCEGAIDGVELTVVSVRVGGVSSTCVIDANVEEGVELSHVMAHVAGQFF